jgi:hypothetical protein
MISNPENINLFRPLFKGREDVFAVHREKGYKSGYMPAYCTTTQRTKKALSVWKSSLEETI